jgi:HEPN domain-containing protein
MNRSDLQRLSNTRIREAKVLFAAGEYGGAYYLAGYAVECALKACFARSVKRYDFPDKKGAAKVFTHKLPELVTLADLDAALLGARKSSQNFAAGWDAVCKWTEESRYSSLLAKGDAEELLDAIVRRKDGVLPWIKRHW